MQVPCLTAVRDSCSGHKGQSECEFEYKHFTLAFSSHAPEAHKLNLKLTLFFWVCRSKISSHSNSCSRGAQALTLFFLWVWVRTLYFGLFFTCSRGAQAQSHTHAVFLSVKEENILKLKLTLFFCGFEYERFTLAFSLHPPEANRRKPTLTLIKCKLFIWVFRRKISS